MSETLRVVVNVGDPQPGIDALVEAGVLEEHTHDRLRHQSCYAVAQPHTHEWRVVAEADSLMGPPGLRHGFSLRIACNCGKWAEVRNRLPIEVPE